MSLFGHKQKTVEPDVIPTTVEQAIPIRDVCEDGIFSCRAESLVKDLPFYRCQLRNGIQGG